PAPPSPPPARREPPLSPVNARVFTIYDGRDLYDAPYLTKQGITQNECIELCKQDNKCIAFSWDRWNNYCFLKRAAPATMRIDPQSMSAVAIGERQPTDSSATVEMEHFYNTEFRD